MELFTAILGAFLIALLIVWIGFNPFDTVRDEEKRKRMFAKRNIKYVSMGNLFVDTVKKVQLEIKRHKAILDNGPVFGHVLMGSPTIMIADPEVIELVLSKHFTNFVNRRSLPVIDPFFSEFIFMSEGERWKRIRSTLTPTFASGKIRILKSVLDETVGTLLKNTNDSIATVSNDLDVRDLFGAFTMNSIIQMAFGIRINCVADRSNPIYVHGTQFSQTDFSLYRSIKGTIMYLSPYTAKLLNLRLFNQEFEFFAKISEDIIEKKRKSLESNPNQKASNYVELILEAEAERKKLEESSDESSKAVKFLTNREILAQSIMFFIAGFDTVQTVLTHTMYELAIHQDYQQQLYEEIDEILGVDAGKDPFEVFSYDVINKMRFLEAVLKETLRLHTPATNAERRADEDIVLKTSKHELHIKKGDIMLIPIYSVHRDPDNFPEPDVFDPNRFLGETTHHKYSYLPFGAGPRDCIARSMAYFEVKIAILHFIRCFRVETCSKTPFPIQYYFQILGGGLINKQVHLKVLPRS